MVAVYLLLDVYETISLFLFYQFIPKISIHGIELTSILLYEDYTIVQVTNSYQ